MKEEITKRIIEYLELETNYAIIINGNYGIGKTHYLKNELFPEIKKLEVPNSKKDENFTPLLVSLFGVKSIEDIQSQIFVELFPILKSRGVKIAAGLGNGILKFFNNDLNDLISETGTASSFTDYKKILICIDDIDRKGKELDIQEVFGFVNNLVENFGAKIILIANEDELRQTSENEQDSYSLLREKVVGVSVSFKAELDKTFDEIIKSKYKNKDSKYYNFLGENKKQIVSVIELNKNNLRNLLFFLEHFKIIFKQLKLLLKNEQSLREFREEIFQKVLSFTLPIAFEYKSGKLQPEHFEKIRQLYTNGYFDMSAFLNEGPEVQFKSTKEKTKTYKEEYRDRYLDTNQQSQIILFDSIFNYITGESAFSITSLKEEINSIYRLENEKLPRREIILRKLSYWKCIDIPYLEYRSLTNEMLKLTDNSEYSLDQYPTIFHYATRFENPLNYNLGKLVKRIKRGIQKGNFEYKANLQSHFSISINSEYYSDLKEIGDFCIKINDEIKNEIESEEISELFELFNNDIDDFLVNLNEKNSTYRFSPIFLKFKFNKFWRAFKNLSNSKIIEFAYVLNRRYTKQIYPELLPEKKFLENLKINIITHIDKSSTTKLDKVAYEFFLNHINESLLNFE